jgi:hypothetical protein
MKELTLRVVCTDRFCDDEGRGCRFCRARQTPRGMQAVCILFPLGGQPLTELVVEGSRAVRSPECVKSAKDIEVRDAEFTQSGSESGQPVVGIA